MIKTCCPLLGIPLAFMPPGFLTTLQMSSTFLSVSTHSLSGLSCPCSKMSNLAASELNQSCKYISWCHEAILSGPCTLCIHLILSVIIQFIFYDAITHLKVAPFSHILHQSFPLLHGLLQSQGLMPLVCSLHQVHSLL